MFDEDETVKKPTEITLPRKLDGLSITELQDYIATLKLEILRTEAKIEEDNQHKNAAEALFK